MKSDYFFFLPPFFLPPFFFVAMFLFSLFHYSWMCGSKRKTAIDDCIDSLKIEVKQKIDDHLGSGVEERLTLGVLLVSHPTELRQEINGDAGKRIVAMHALSFSDAKLFSQDNQRAERVADGDRERWYLGNHSQSQIIAAIALEAHVVTD